MNAPTDIAGGRLASTGASVATRCARRVLAANDGLVSNLSPVVGVAGAGLDNDVILITRGAVSPSCPGRPQS